MGDFLRHNTDLLTMVFTILLAVATCILCFVSAWQARLMRVHAAHFAELAARTKEIAELANKNVEALKRVECASVHLVDIRFYKVRESFFGVGYVLLNSGRTDATRVEIASQIFVIGNEHGSQFKSGTVITIPAGATFEAHHSCDAPTPDDIYQKIVDGTWSTKFKGRLTFEDAFGDPHQTPFHRFYLAKELSVDGQPQFQELGT